jgi:hypothetical protein
MLKEIIILINNYEPPVFDKEDNWALFNYLCIKELINHKSDK